MINKKDIIADLHTHTAFSGHAYSTIKENIECAKNQGIKFLATTDHYYANGDEIDKKNELNRIKYQAVRLQPCYDDIILIDGAEFNINQDIYNPEKLLPLPWMPIGLHTWFIDVDNTSFTELFKLYQNAIKIGFNAFVHIERELHRVTNKNFVEYMYKLVDLAVDNDIWLEVNESSIVINDHGAAERLRIWLEYAKSRNAKIYLGSDAHYCEEVGRFDNAIKLLNDLKYPKENILNCREDWLLDLFVKE